MSRISFLSFKRDKPLSELSTFKIGGLADYFIEIKEIPDLLNVINFCNVQGLPFHIVGRGSNSLFSDRGFRGLIIHNKIDFIESNKETFRVGAGFNFSLLGTQTARAGYSGLEFASGIPASLGGAVYMNAGANGGETCDFLTSVEYLSHDVHYNTYTKDELKFSYRHSPFQEKKGIILAATFKLVPSAEAREKQLKIIDYRKKTQPLQEPSVGCVFQNPAVLCGQECLSAGALIEKIGLKGLQVGGVKVSEKHANFIVNSGGGRALDVLTLIKIIKERVFIATGITLQEEVRLIHE